MLQFVIKDVTLILCEYFLDRSSRTTMSQMSEQQALMSKPKIIMFQLRQSLQANQV